MDLLQKITEGLSAPRHVFYSQTLKKGVLYKPNQTSLPNNCVLFYFIIYTHHKERERERVIQLNSGKGFEGHFPILMEPKLKGTEPNPKYKSYVPLFVPVLKQRHLLKISLLTEVS